MSVRLVVSNVSCGEPATGGRALSRSKLLDRHRMARIAPEIWAGFLRDRFANPEAVACWFGVRNSTAWNWWGALNRPAADKVMLAVLELDFAGHLSASVEADAWRAA